MTGAIYKERPEVLTLVQAQRYLGERYRAGDGFPEIEHVAAAGGVPEHGLIHLLEGDITVNLGDYVTSAPGVEGSYPGYGFSGAYPWYQFEAQYEPK
jgi:hypothetical protein